MADSSLVIRGNSGAETISARTNASGEKMEAVVIGIDGSDSIVPGDATQGLKVDTRDIAGTATLTNISGINSSATLLVANTARRGVVLHNDSTAVLYLKYGLSASSTSYTYKIPPDGT